MSSFRKINYSLRPAKHAERRMMGEIFRRVSSFAPLEDYSYVGLGSVWFADFALYHKTLGISDMISIEKSTGARARFESNRPFNITMKFKSTTDALPEIKWAKRSIVWLDYDGVISKDILLDARALTSRCKSGSVFAFSVNCEKARQVSDAENQPDGPSALVRFREEFGRGRVGADIGMEDLQGRPFAKLSRSLLLREVEDALAARNSAGKDRYRFAHIASFNYKDDAPMTTVVGVLYSESEAASFENCRFDDLDILRGGEKVIDINVPKLTVKELRFLEKQFPIEDGADLDLSNGIPEKEAKAFSRLYRYFPNFAVLEG